jgi:hypothetical protein
MEEWFHDSNDKVEVDNAKPLIGEVLQTLQALFPGEDKTNGYHIDRNCDVLPLSLEDLLNYTTLMLKFCTNKPIWALLLRQVFLGGGKGVSCPKKGRKAPSAGYKFLRKKILHKLNTYCMLL